MLRQVHSSGQVLSAEDHLLEDSAMSYAYLSLPSLFPNNTDKNKNSRES